MSDFEVFAYLNDFFSLVLRYCLGFDVTSYVEELVDSIDLQLEHLHVSTTPAAVRLEKKTVPQLSVRQVHLRAEVPEEKVANSLILQSALEEKAGQIIVEVQLVLEHLVTRRNECDGKVETM